MIEYLKGAMPDDEEDESFADQMRADKNKDADEKDETDPLHDELNQVDDDEAAKVLAKDERDADLDAEEETYKKRYGDLKSDRDEKVRLLRDTMAENARLKATKTADSELNEAALVKEMQDGLYAEIQGITETDAEKGREAAYRIIGKYQAQSIKKAVELAVKQVQVQREQEVQATTDNEQKRAGATRLAKIALKEIGLDPEKDLSEFQHQVDQQMETDPDWFRAIPADQHFLRLAKRVQQKLKETKDANDDHRRDAGGTITSSSRVRRPTKETEESDELDTMKGAMGLANRANLARGKKAFQLAHLR